MQIGANDSVSFDWLYDFVTRNRLKGLVVEPLADLFQELRVNCQDHAQVTPVNVATHRTAREIDLYRVDPKRSEGLPEWTKAIASVDPLHHLKSATPSEVIISERVRCITLAELFDQHAVHRIDFLQVDVEGYDHEIIKMLDFGRLKPAIIRFEHNLAKQVKCRRDLLTCCDLLVEAGYHVLMGRMNAVAYLPAV